MLQDNELAVERPPLTYKRAGEALKHDWDKKPPGLRLRRRCCSCRKEVLAGLVCRICCYESCAECLYMQE